jgi:DNA (cytosine-5)-methyltransferase 1
MVAYYNENDPFAAAWLRELIKDNLIAPGDVDERSIEDVTPVELRPYDQCHFFAGIGGWSYALRLAGWPDEKPVWTGSCPCQPFSSAGKGGGFDDKRHLWPAFFWLIQQSRPDTIFGEQVASKDGLGWLDLVQSDMEGEDYAISAFDLCAAGVGAPHIRQRLFWVADSNSARQQREGPTQPAGWQYKAVTARGKSNLGLADSNDSKRRAGAVPGLDNVREEKEWNKGTNQSRKCGAAGSLADTKSSERERSSHSRGRFPRFTDDLVLGNPNGQRCKEQRQPVTDQSKQLGAELPGFWSAVEWLPCLDGKARPTQPGVHPLAHGIPNRVGTLRGSGNAIVPQVAAELIKAFREDGMRGL